MSEKTKAELKEQIKIMNHNYQTIKEMHDRGYRYSVSEIEKLKQELETVRKALDVAVEELTKIKTAAESVGIGFFMTAGISALAKINEIKGGKDEL